MTGRDWRGHTEQSEVSETSGMVLGPAVYVLDSKTAQNWGQRTKAKDKVPRNPGTVSED